MGAYVVAALRNSNGRNARRDKGIELYRRDEPSFPRCVNPHVFIRHCPLLQGSRVTASARRRDARCRRSCAQSRSHATLALREAACPRHVTPTSCDGPQKRLFVKCKTPKRTGDTVVTCRTKHDTNGRASSDAWRERVYRTDTITTITYALSRTYEMGMPTVAERRQHTCTCSTSCTWPTQVSGLCGACHSSCVCAQDTRTLLRKEHYEMLPRRWLAAAGGRL